MLLVAGCGGSSGGTASTSASQTGASVAAQSQPAGVAATTASSAQAPAQATTPSSATTGASSRTHPAIAAANAICARRNHELTAVPEGGTDVHALLAASRTRAAIEERALGELEKLTPPSGIAKQYGELVAFYKQALLKIVKVGERAEAGDAAGARRARERADVNPLRLLVLTIHTGLRDCSGLG